MGLGKTDLRQRNGFDAHASSWAMPRTTPARTSGSTFQFRWVAGAPDNETAFQWEGGAEHCQVDNRQLGVDIIGDWLLKNM